MKMHIESNQPVNIDIHKINYHDRHDHHHRHHEHFVVEPALPATPPPPAYEPPEPEATAHNCFMHLLELVGEAAHSVIKGFLHF